MIIEIKETMVGKHVVTTKEHSSLALTFPQGTRVKVIGVDDIRGYDIENDEGDVISEIGRVI